MHWSNYSLDLVKMLISRKNNELYRLNDEMSRLKRSERMNAISKLQQGRHIVTAIGPKQVVYYNYNKTQPCCNRIVRV